LPSQLPHLAPRHRGPPALIVPLLVRCGTHDLDPLRMVV
jgi:hypothetical protein